MLVKIAAVAALALLLVLAKTPSAPPHVEAATPVLVTSAADSGEGSLRAAIEQANADSDVQQIEIHLGATIRLDSDIVYTGSQPLTINGATEERPAAIAGGAAAECSDALLVSTGGADLVVRNIEFRGSACGGISVAVPADRTGLVHVTIDGVRMRSLGGDGLRIEDTGGAGAGVVLAVASSSFERAGMTGDSAGIEVVETGSGGVTARIKHTDIAESGDYGLRIDEYDAGGVELSVDSASFMRNGGGDLDNDGAISVLETGPGDVAGTFSNTVLRDNAGDGLEFFEEDAGDLALSAYRVQSLNNGLGVTDNIEGFEVDESEEGSLTATLVDVTIAGNYFGLELYEGGVGDADPGDLRVRLIRVSVLDNRSYGLYIDELRGGNLDVAATQLRVDGNGAEDENGAHLLEGGTGDLLLELHAVSFSANAVDGVFIQESDAGNLDAAFVASTVADNGEDGIEAEQLAPDTGVLSLDETTAAGNGIRAVRLLGGVVQR